MLLREVEKRRGIIAQYAACFTDHRDAARIEHGAEARVAQRVYGLALGYEDLNDHDELRQDPWLAGLVEKPDPTGETRARERDQGKARAGQSTLNRLELSAAEVSEKARYKKIGLDFEAVDRMLGAVFLPAHREAPKQIVLDLDSTDDPLPGEPEGRFFHGDSGHYCYWPLYIFCGEMRLCARLRVANLDGAAGSPEEWPRLVGQIRQAWPAVQIIVRGDAGFCREERLAWGEAHQGDYGLGLAKNERLQAESTAELHPAAAEDQRTGQAARVFKAFGSQTRESWARARRVVAKAAPLEKGANPRLGVTSWPRPDWAARALYADLYCARGEMGNRIKEQLLRFADRTSTAFRRSHQIRLYFAAVAYRLRPALRRLGLQGTDLAKAPGTTLRLKRLKIGALLRITVRKVWVSLASGYPDQELFRQVYAQLQAAPRRG